MSKLVIFVGLIISLSNCFASDEQFIDDNQLSEVTSLSFDEMVDFNEAYNSTIICLKYKPVPQCITPGTCQFFLGTTVAIMTASASKAGYPFFGAYVGQQLSNYGAEFCKKPRCYVGSECIKWVAR